MTAPPFCPHCGVSLASDRRAAPPPAAADDDPIPPRPEESAPSSIPGPDAVASALSDPRSFPDPIASAAFSTSDDDRAGATPALLGIEIGGPRPAIGPAPPTVPPEPPAREAKTRATALDDELDDPGPRRPDWRRAALASYASAVTLACAWLWWTGHRTGSGGPGPDWAAGLAASEAADPTASLDAGRRAAASAVVEPPEPIGDGRRTALGEPLRIDALEFTPVAVSAGAVTLHRTRIDGQLERRDGGGGALRLRLLLRNASDDVVFAPLDEAFVREPDRRLPETFLQDAAGTRVYAYRLPIASEWGVAGQDFRELRPGESVETLLVSDVDAHRRLDGTLTWRLRLRTAPETTAVVGVTFEADEIDKDR